MLPLAPDKAEPVDREMDPDFPDSALPVLISTSPLSPFLPKSFVSRTNTPPLLTAMSPPVVLAIDELVDIVMFPDALYAELPVPILIEPER